MSHSRVKNLLPDAYSVLRRPLLTEKSHEMVQAGAEEKKSRYTFLVHPKANKHQIKQAIEQAFGVEVETVNTMIVKPRKKAFRGAMGKSGFSRIKKKAVIRLAKGSKQIELI